jgi:hypothetical protein
MQEVVTQRSFPAFRSSSSLPVTCRAYSSNLKFKGRTSHSVQAKRANHPISRTGALGSEIRVILGGGFGGVDAARRLEQIFGRRRDVEITLISAENLLLFTPRPPKWSRVQSMQAISSAPFELSFEQ